MLPSANQKGSGVCAGTSKWTPSGTSAAKAVIAFAAFTAALKRLRHPKEKRHPKVLLQTSIEKLYQKSLPRTPTQNLYSENRSRSNERHKLMFVPAIHARPSSTNGYLYSYGTASSVAFTIFRKNFRQAIVLSVGADNSYIAILRSAASAGSLPFLAIDPALSSTK